MDFPPILAGEARTWIQHACYFLLLLACLRKGGGPEKLSAIVLAGMIVVDQFYHFVGGHGGLLAGVDRFHAGLDTIACALLIAIALKANRSYTLWLAGFQIVAVMAHIARFVTPDILPIAYYVMYVGPSWLQLVTLAIGLMAHIQRETQHGSYRSWRGSSPRSPAMAPGNWPNG